MTYAAPKEPAEASTRAVELPTLAKRIERFDDWEEKTRKNRKLSRRDRDYYDSIQWTPEEEKILRLRGQPTIVKNYIARKINFILGEEIKKRVDPVARPRTPQHEDSARAATDALRYVEEEQKFDECRSAVAKNLLIEGMGGALKEIERSGDGSVKHVLRHIEWARLFYDPHSRDPLFRDAMYLGLVVWMDLIDAIATWPDAEEILKAALSKDIGNVDYTTEDVPRRWGDKRRERVKICEQFFRVGDDWYRSVFTQAGDLEEPARTAYLDEKKEHSVCPLKLASCYVDAEGNRYGVVRALISPQDEINKRSSKALHLISVNQMVYEDGAVPDPQKAQAESAKPDGAILVNPGALNEKRVEFNRNTDLAAGQVQLLQEAKADINSIGPSSSNMPDLPESSSGRAFIARQQAASQELGAFFDSLRSWTLSIFELDWLCVRQEWTDEMWLRVTDDEELTGYRFTPINRKMTRAQRLQELLEKGVALEQALGTAAGNLAPAVVRQANQQMQMLQVPPEQSEQALPQLILRNPVMQQPITENQVDQMLMDIILDVAPDTATIAMEEFDALSEFGAQLVQLRPDMGPTLVKLLLKASQLRNKRELLQELEKGPDPQAMQMQQQQQALQVAGMQAGVAVQESQAQLNQARAASEQAKTAKTPSEIEVNQARAMRDAAQAGQAAGGSPGPGAGNGIDEAPSL